MHASDILYAGDYPTVEEITRNRVLDAGIRCLDRYGYKKTTISLIAEESGITRQTVYNYFRNKDELLSQAFLREGVRLGVATANYIERFDSVQDKFVGAFLFIYEHFPQNPILMRVLEPASDFYYTAGMSSFSFAEFGELVLADVFQQNDYLRANADSICELWIRSVLSFLTMPGQKTKTRAELETFVRMRLVPGIGLR